MSEDGDRDYEANLRASTVTVSALDYVLCQYIARINETLARDRWKQAKLVGLQALLKFTNKHLMRSTSSVAIAPTRWNEFRYCQGRKVVDVTDVVMVKEEQWTLI